HLETIPKHQSKTDIKKTPHPQHGAPRAWQKQQQTKTTKHTIEFSNNRPTWTRSQPAAKSRVLAVRADENPRNRN
ncbi:hypothetical protein, partial [Mycolicibacter nonchromogenicus]|uniref:hypothetical protein n=1 Tax=Mycolicibacter nonchromogenicus TaxID=1782 RepID=UPI001A958AAF